MPIRHNSPRVSVIIPIAAIFGAAFGSFLNVVILRFPHQSFGGRSRCPHCHRQLTFWDLIPVLSWLWLRGRCRSCLAPISIQYPIVEFFGAASAALLAKSVTAFTFHPVIALLLFFIVSLLIVLFVIDLRTMLLPDIFIFILVGLTILILVGNIFATPYLSNPISDYTAENPLRYPAIASNLPWTLSTPISFYSALLGAFIGAGSILALWFLTSGRGIGFGDVKLMIPLGFLFGPIHTVILLFTAFICGGLFGTYLLLTKQATLKTAVPFGPFLAGVAIIFILFPQVPKYLLSIIY